jgi:hypothetical protein
MAGEIQNIFQHWHTNPDNMDTQSIYLVVNEYAQVPAIGRADPYKRYPRALGCIYGAQQIETYLIEAEHVVSHFALTPMEHEGMELIHVMPLNRVGLIPSCLRNQEPNIVLVGFTRLVVGNSEHGK